MKTIAATGAPWARMSRRMGTAVITAVGSVIKEADQSIGTKKATEAIYPFRVERSYQIYPFYRWNANASCVVWPTTR